MCSFLAYAFANNIIQGLGAKNDDVFSTQFQEVCTSTCDIVAKSNFLPSALVGAFGEALAMPTLRLVSSLADNASTKRSHQQLVRSGVLGVLADMLRNAMNGKSIVLKPSISLQL